MTDKEQATRLADALDAYGETTAAESNLRAKVSALLRRWPDDAERIAALEAALEQARAALEWARDLNEVAQRSSVINNALRAIEEVK